MNEIIIAALTAQDMLNQLMPVITPIITPIIVALVKKISDKIPKWSLPILAGLFGGVIQVIDNALGGQLQWYWGLLLGLAGVGVREIYDQLKKIGENATQTNN